MGKKYTNIYTRTNAKLEDKLLPIGMSNRTGEKQVPEYIVIHETSTGIRRRPADYDLKHYEDKLYQDAEERGTTISYHFLCSDDRVWQFLPEDEATCHTGTKEGNHNSIGIERLVNEKVNFGKALHNQAKLTATLMKKWNIPIENVKLHRGMQWKYTPDRVDKTPCPSRMIAGQYGGFNRFLFEIKRCQEHKWYFEELLQEQSKQEESSKMSFGGFDRDDDR